MAEEQLKEQIVSLKGIEKIIPALDEMGFTFSKSDRFPKLIGVKLPEDYTYVIVSDTKKINQSTKIGEKNFNKEHFCEERIIIIDFFDSLGIKRGSFYISKPNNNASTILLNKRLNIHHQMHGVMDEIYFGTEDTKLISFGSVNTEVGSVMYIASRRGELTEKTKQAATAIYPEWKNPAAYWDKTDEELVAMLPKTEERGQTRSRTNSKLPSSNNN